MSTRALRSTSSVDIDFWPNRQKSSDEMDLTGQPAQSPHSDAGGEPSAATVNKAQEMVGMMDPTSFILCFQEALQDKRVVSLFQSALVPLFQQQIARIDALEKSNKKLNATLDKKDTEIASLKSRCTVLEDSLDDLEQWGRRGSMRIQGLPESNPEDVDQKIQDLCNNVLKLDPPLELSEIEVSHRLPGRSIGINPKGADGSQTKPPGPKGVIVKFMSRRSKARVMAKRKKLEKIDVNENTKNDYPHEVFFSDDLTSKRAKLAFRARQLMRSKKIAETWVYDSKIFVKDNHGRISRPIRGEKDLLKFEKPPQEEANNDGND